MTAPRGNLVNFETAALIDWSVGRCRCAKTHVAKNWISASLQGRILVPGAWMFRDGRFLAEIIAMDGSTS